MNRLTFLKTIGGLLALPAVAVKAIQARPAPRGRELVGTTIVYSDGITGAFWGSLTVTKCQPSVCGPSLWWMEWMTHEGAVVSTWPREEPTLANLSQLSGVAQDRIIELRTGDTL